MSWLSKKREQILKKARTPRLKQWADRGLSSDIIFRICLDWEKMNRQARRLGDGYRVHHIYPVWHTQYCGLSVPWNFQVVTHEKAFEIDETGRTAFNLLLKDRSDEAGLLQTFIRHEMPIESLFG